MLYVVLKNVRRMLKYKLITQAVWNEFQTTEIHSPETQSKELGDYVRMLRKRKRLAGE